jgi:hypothetical protein
VSRSYDALAKHILRPRRPRLGAARAAVAGIADPQEAWEALAVRDLIPAAWVQAGDREFVQLRPRCKTCGGDGAPFTSIDSPPCPHCNDTGRSWRVASSPPTVEFAVALAADAAVVAAVEALGRAAAHHAETARSHAPRTRRIRWELVPPDAPAPPHPKTRDPRGAAWGSLGILLMPWLDDRYFDEIARLQRASGVPDQTAPFLVVAAPANAWHAALCDVATDLRHQAVWTRIQAAARRGRRARPVGASYRQQAERAHAQLAGRASPYEPVLSIWRLGYALSAVTDDAIVLVAPAAPVESPTTASC